jgi:7-cyano-7-deazaguanine synthase
VKDAVVLLSGGLDSATCLALAKEAGFQPVCLLVQYGQRHAVELRAARAVAASFGVQDVREVGVDLRAIGGSALTADMAVPKDRPDGARAAGVPVTYVPARNTLLLSLALGLAEVVGARDIFIGVNAVDYSGYPDCRPEFIRAFEGLASLATKAGVEGQRFHIHAPLLRLSKADIIRTGQRLGQRRDAVRTQVTPAAVCLGLLLSAPAAAAPPLVDAAEVVPGLVVDLRYAQDDNAFHQAFYPKGARCLLLRPVAARLARAAEALAKEGFRLKAWDCYRPHAVQWSMWAAFPRRGYVADPHTGSQHNRAAAVDVTLVRLDGTAVEMPTPFDTFSPAAHHDAKVSADVAARRALLRAAMETAGFRKNRMEWWHYEAPEANGAPLLDVPLNGPAPAGGGGPP